MMPMIMPSSHATMADATGYCLMILILNCHSHFRNRFIYPYLFGNGKGRPRPASKTDASAKIFTYLSAVGKQGICQLTPNRS